MPSTMIRVVSAPPPASRVARSAVAATAGAAGTNRASRLASASASTTPSVSPMRRHSFVRVARLGTRNSRHIVIRRSTAGPSASMSLAVQIIGTRTCSRSRCRNTRVGGRSNVERGLANRSSASSNSSSVSPGVASRCAMRSPASRSCRCGSLPNSSASVIGRRRAPTRAASVAANDVLPVPGGP